MSALIDNDLAPQRAARLQRHVARCRRCARVLVTLRATVQSLTEFGDAPAPARASVADAVVKRVQREAADAPNAHRESSEGDR